MFSQAMKICAQRKAGRRKHVRHCFPSLPFPWSVALLHQSLAFCAGLYAKPCENEAPEEEAAPTPMH